MATISERLRKIADASRRADGSDIPLGQEVREAADVIDDLVKALEKSTVAVDDWVHQYAPDECRYEHVQNTRRRILDAGGTLAYIAEVQQSARSALSRARKE